MAALDPSSPWGAPPTPRSAPSGLRPARSEIGRATLLLMVVMMVAASPRLSVGGSGRSAVDERVIEVRQTQTGQRISHERNDRDEPEARPVQHYKPIAAAAPACARVITPPHGRFLNGGEVNSLQRACAGGLVRESQLALPPPRS